MVKCPKCKEEIEVLINIQSGWKTYRCWLDSKGKYLEYEEKEFNVDNNVDEFSCPECGQVLFTTEKEALEFLKK